MATVHVMSPFIVTNVPTRDLGSLHKVVYSNYEIGMLALIIIL